MSLCSSEEETSQACTQRRISHLVSLTLSVWSYRTCCCCTPSCKMGSLLQCVHIAQCEAQQMIGRQMMVHTRLQR